MTYLATVYLIPLLATIVVAGSAMAAPAAGHAPAAAAGHAPERVATTTRGHHGVEGTSSTDAIHEDDDDLAASSTTTTVREVRQGGGGLSEHVDAAPAVHAPTLATVPDTTVHVRDVSVDGQTTTGTRSDRAPPR